MSCDIYLSEPFKRSVKRLLKRFPHAKKDLGMALEEIAESPALGVLIPGSGGVRKVRVRSTDLRRGKSGGFRLVYLYEPERQLVIPLLAYAKSDRADVTMRELRSLLAELDRG